MTLRPTIFENHSIETNYLFEIIQDISKNELKENTSSREQHLIKFRNILLSNVDIQNLRIDDNFLLRFLRVKKYNISLAEQTVLKYLNLRKIYPQMCTHLDCLEEKQNIIVSNGYIFVSPIRDKLGRRYVFVTPKLFNPKLFSSADQAKAHILAYETLLEDPVNQIIGFIHVGDLSGLGLSHILNWNPTDFARILRWGEQSIPVRHKAVHLFNVPVPFKWIIDFVKGRISQKMKNRFHAYTNAKELKNHVDVECLPKEMGGTIPMREMIQSWKKELLARREALIALDKMALLSDRGIACSRNRTHIEANNNPNNQKMNYNYNFKNMTKHDKNGSNFLASFNKLELD